MTRRTSVAVALVLACMIAGAGCRKRRSSTTIVRSGSDIFTTDGFPGAPVQDHNVADDRRALSPSGEDVTGSFFVVRNGSRGQAVLTYRTANGWLFANYFDGETWTPPVLLNSPDAAIILSEASTSVAFLNTADHPDANARERDGDAIILWRCNDLPLSTPLDDFNICLWATYVNASQREDASKNYGFQTFATRLSSQDGTMEDVEAAGFVSDGLCGEARYGPGGFRVYSWGDATTSLATVWTQVEDNDAVSAGFEADRFWAYTTWDVAQPGDPELPLVPGAETRGPVLGFGASDSGPDSEETQVDADLVAYNDTLLFRVATNQTALADAVYFPAILSPWGTLSAETDITIQAVTFDVPTGATSAPISLHALAPDATDGVQTQAAFVRPASSPLWFVARPTAFGSDEGLATLSVWTAQLVSDPDTTFGGMTGDGRLALAEIDEADGTLGGLALIDVDEPSLDGDAPELDTFRAEISRNGDYAWAAWNDLVDAAPAGASADDALGLYVAQYTTTRFDDDGLAPAVPPIGSTTHAALPVSTVIPGGFDASVGKFQTGLGYVCGIQSDPDVMNVFFQHSDSMADIAWHVRLVADLDPSDGTAPVVSASPLETFENGTFAIDLFESAAGGTLAAADAGHDGEALVYYVQDVAPGSAFELVIFAEDTGTGARVAVDTGDPAMQVGAIAVFATPPGTEIGRVDSVTGEDVEARAHPARFIHAFWIETAGYEYRLFTRARESGDFSDPGDAFVPGAGAEFEPPFQLSLPGMPDAYGFSSITIDGDAVGIWFFQQDHIYYQEADQQGRELAWNRREDGASDPWLVDDDTGESVADAIGSQFLAVVPNACACDTLHGAMAVWLKQFGPNSQVRLQCRVRE